MGSVLLVEKSDAVEVEELCKRAFYQVGYDKPPRCYKYDSQHIIKVVSNGVVSPDHILTKYVRGGKILGFMAVGVTDFSFYAVGHKTAYEIVWHGDPLLSPPDQLRVQIALLKDMLERTKDVDLSSITIDERHLELLKVVERYGFEPGNRVCIKRRQPWAT